MEEIDINPTKKQTVSDDPELAKVLAGINSGAAKDGEGADAADNQEEIELFYEANDGAPADDQANQPVVEAPQPAAQPEVAPVNLGGLDLDGIKNMALHDLRPLVDKLNVSQEEKFDIYLLLLRSSDDKTLIEPAYQAARLIEDETKRANSLLDIIKEIDYFNSRNNPAAQ